MIPDVGGGSTLSRMYITLIDSTLFLFLRLARCLLKGGIAQRLRRVPELRHWCPWPPPWPPPWQKSSYKADEAVRVLLVCWAGIEPTALYMLDTTTELIYTSHYVT